MAEDAAQRIGGRGDHVPAQRVDHAAVTAAVAPTPGEHHGVVEIAHGFGDEPGLADAGRPGDEHRPPLPVPRGRDRPARRARSSTRSAKGAPPVASSAGGLGTTEARADGDHDTSYGAARFGKALELEAAAIDERDPGLVVDEEPHRLRREDLAGTARVAQARRLDDGRAEPVVLLRRCFAGREADANREPERGIALRERGDRLLPCDRAGDRVGDAVLGTRP